MRLFSRTIHWCCRRVIGSENMSHYGRVDNRSFVLHAVWTKRTGRISQKRFNLEQLQINKLQGHLDWHSLRQALPDMILLATSGRLQSVIEYCIKAHKTAPASTESNISATVWLRITINGIHNVSNGEFKLSGQLFGWPEQLVGFLFVLELFRLQSCCYEPS